jgi:hypothetical protein
MKFIFCLFYSSDMQQGFVVCCFFLLSSVLGPVVWQLWIYSRSANANFYFGVTLAFATAQVSNYCTNILCHQYFLVFYFKLNSMILKQYFTTLNFKSFVSFYSFKRCNKKCLNSYYVFYYRFS